MLKNRKLQWALLALMLVTLLGATAQGRLLLRQISGGTAGQIPVSNGTYHVGRTVSGDGALSSTGVLDLTDTAATPGEYGSATESIIATVDAEGRVTAITESLISGVAPGGSASGVLDGSYPGPGLAASVAGAGLTETTNVLSINVDESTLTLPVDTLLVKDGGITATQIAGSLKPSGTAAAGDEALRALGTTASTAAAGNDSRLSDSRAPNGSASGALDGSYPGPGLAAAVAGAGLGESADVLSVTVDNSTVEINTDTLRVKDAGITPAKLSATHGQLVITFCAAFTPAGTGVDTAEFTIPYYDQDGTTSVTYQLKRVSASFAVAGGAPALMIDKSTTALTSAFGAGTDMLSANMTAGSGNYGVTSTSVAAGASSQVSSGNRVRMDVTTLGTATGWTVTAEFVRIS